MFKTIMIKSALIALVWSLALSAHAMADAPRQITVPAGDLIQALESLANQADVDLIYQADQLKGLRTSGLSGAFTPQQAVTELLEGTSLTLHEDSTGALLITSDQPSAVSGDDPDAGPKAVSPGVTAEGADQSDPDPDMGLIVVTGSRIARPNMTSAGPISTVTSTEILQQAPVNVEEIINRLPQAAPDSQQNYQDSDGRQRLKLRNLGFERTLVLVDGLRLGTQNGQDTSIIPVSLIDRVDVLTGGASSVYGSDAVAGVINFVLKKNFTGVRLDANYDFYQHDNKSNFVTDTAAASGFPSSLGNTTDGGRADITLTAGKEFFDDRLNASAFVNYRQADLVPYGARSTSACYIPAVGANNALSCQLSTYSPSGYISPRSGANNGTAYVNNPNGDGSFVPYGVGAGNAANPFDGYSYQREFERWTAGGFASFEIAPKTEIYANTMWSEDTSHNRFPTRVLSYTVYGSTPYQVNCNNPFLSASQASTLCGAQAGTSTLVPLEVRYRFNALPYSLDEYINEGIRTNAGVRGRFREAWNYDVSAVYARNRQDQTPSNLPDFDKVNNSLNVVSVAGVPKCASAVSGADAACVPFDAFHANQNNVDLANYLLTAESGTTTGVGTLRDLVASLSGDLGRYGVTSPLAKQGVAVAFGLEYRREAFDSYADAIYREQNGGEDFSIAQSVNEVNFEVQAPVIEEHRWAHLVQLNGGYRISKYTNNPDRFSTYKMETLWAPVEDFTFRGSYNKAQRAPTVIEVRQASGVSYDTRALEDPCAPGADGIPDASIETCRATGLPDSLYGSPTLNCPDGNCTVKIGGFTADPETAYTKTVGIVARPRFVPNLVLSADLFDIKIDNSLGYNDADYFRTGCIDSGGDPFFCSGIVRNPGTGTIFSTPSGNPATGFYRAGTTNYYKSTTRGWDFQGQYAFEFGNGGRLDSSFNGTRTTDAGGQDSPLLPERNCAGYYGNGCGQLVPKWMHSLRTTYTTPNKLLSASVNWRYIGSLTHADNSGDPAIGGTPDRARTSYFRFGAADYFDLSFGTNVWKRYDLRLVINNVLDKSAPIMPGSRDISLTYNNSVPQRYDSLGRAISLGVSAKF